MKRRRSQTGRYDTAIDAAAAAVDGDTIPAMIPNRLPEDIRSAFENSHPDRLTAVLPEEKTSKERFNSDK